MTWGKSCIDTFMICWHALWVSTERKKYFTGKVDSPTRRKHSYVTHTQALKENGAYLVVSTNGKWVYLISLAYHLKVTTFVVYSQVYFHFPLLLWLKIYFFSRCNHLQRHAYRGGRMVINTNRKPRSQPPHPLRVRLVLLAPFHRLWSLCKHWNVIDVEGSRLAT